MNILELSAIGALVITIAAFFLPGVRSSLAQETSRYRTKGVHRMKGEETSRYRTKGGHRMKGEERVCNPFWDFLADEKTGFERMEARIAEYTKRGRLAAHYAYV